MTRVIVLVLVGVLLGMVTVATRATTGGPETIDVLGFDQSGRKILFLRAYHDESGRPRELLAFELLSRYPDRLVRQDWYREDFGRWAPLDPERWIRYRKSLMPLRVRPGTHDFRLRVTVDSLASRRMWSGEMVPASLVHGTIVSGDTFVQFTDTTYFDAPVGILGVYEIPGERVRVAILRSLANPFEGGYTADRPLLLEPGE